MRDLASEKQVFLIMQACVFGILLIVLLITNISFDFSRDSVLPPESNYTPVCGDGFLTDGETAQTCCLDAGCSEGYFCSSTNECLLAGKNDSAVFKEFVRSGKTLISRSEAYVEKDELVGVQSLFAQKLSELQNAGFVIDNEQAAYQVITRHSDTINMVRDANRRIQPVTASDLYLGVVLNDGFASQDDLATLKVTADLAVKAFSDTERFITYLNNIDSELETYLFSVFEFNTTQVIEDYRVRQSFFDEIALNMDNRGIIVYRSILDSEVAE